MLCFFRLSAFVIVFHHLKLEKLIALMTDLEIYVQNILFWDPDDKKLAKILETAILTTCTENSIISWLQ